MKLAALAFASLAVTLVPAGSAAQDFPILATPEVIAKTQGGPAAKWPFVLVDARSEVEFAEGHIPGAVLVPAKLAGKLLPKAVADKKRLVVFYCNGPTCTKSNKAAREAAAAGYTNLAEYREGLPGWIKAGQRVEGTPNPPFEATPISPTSLAAELKAGAKPLLVDIRDADEYEGGHLPGALSVPLDSIPAKAGSLPPGRIVLVDHAGHQTAIAARLLAKLGRKELSKLDGGVLTWKAGGLPIDK